MKKNLINIGPIFPLEEINSSFKIISHDVELHWHSFYEIEFIIEGKGKHIINGKEYPIKSGMLQLICPSDSHEYILESPLKVYVIQFPLSILNGALVQAILTQRKQKENFCILLKEEFENLKNVCMLTIKQNEHFDVFQKEFNNSLLNILLISLIRNLPQENFLLHKKNCAPKINEIISFLQENFAQQITSKEISETFFLSHSYFLRYFKSEVGVSLADYLKKLRTQHAKKLIETTSMSVLHISLECGYSSISTFLRDFRNEYNCTPTQMRKEDFSSNSSE